MNSNTDHPEGLAYDDEGHVLWPTSVLERERVAEAVIGVAVIDAVCEVGDVMSAEADGEPSEASLTREAEARSEVFRSLSSEQRSAVQHLVRETARQTAYSIFLAWEQCPHGRIELGIAPGGPEPKREPPVPVRVVEWHQAFLDWEQRFGRK